MHIRRLKKAAILHVNKKRYISVHVHDQIHYENSSAAVSPEHISHAHRQCLSSIKMNMCIVPSCLIYKHFLHGYNIQGGIVHRARKHINVLENSCYNVNPDIYNFAEAFPGKQQSGVSCLESNASTLKRPRMGGGWRNKEIAFERSNVSELNIGEELSLSKYPSWSAEEEGICVLRKQISDYGKWLSKPRDDVKLVIPGGENGKDE